jgi:hypothetical protein
MILPKQLLQETKYYIESEHSEYMTRFTVFTLYPKRWWRFKKIIKIEWMTIDVDDKSATLRKSANILQLSTQLQEHFSQ